MSDLRPYTWRHSPMLYYMDKDMVCVSLHSSPSYVLFSTATQLYVLFIFFCHSHNFYKNIWDTQLAADLNQLIYFSMYILFLVILVTQENFQNSSAIFPEFSTVVYTMPADHWCQWKPYAEADAKQCYAMTVWSHLHRCSQQYFNGRCCRQ